METLVVGVDGSDASLAALRWAQDLARRTGASVKVVAAWVIPPTDGAGSGGGSAYVMDQLEQSAQTLLDKSLEAVPADGVERTAETAVSLSVSGALITAAADADLLVVGTRAHSRVERIVGPVAAQCAQHAPCPFVAVPESALLGANLVAVAYDGSESARAALEWAATITAPADLKLRVIAVWERSVWSSGPEFEGDPRSPEERAVEALRAAVHRVVPNMPDDVEYRPVPGPHKVTPYLLEAAEGASLLVLGSRGRGGFTGLLLGSVSQRCLESSPIPVAVLRG